MGPTTRHCNTKNKVTHNVPTRITGIFSKPLETQSRRNKPVLYYLFIRLTTASGQSDALVDGTTAVNNSPVDTSVVVGERLHQRRVVEVGSTVRAAIIVVAVPAAIEPMCWKKTQYFL